MLDRSFKASAPNRKWIADFTYIWTAEGWLYVAAVVDLFSRRVVGWSMSAAMTAQLVTDALMMAIWRRGKPDALLHHSDRGSQYTSEQFQRLMADHGVTCSMSRSGNVWDNAAMESFFSSLKTERTARKTVERGTKPKPMCSITSNASTTPSAALDDRLSEPYGVRDEEPDYGRLKMMPEGINLFDSSIRPFGLDRPLLTFAKYDAEKRHLSNCGHPQPCWFLT